jgi:hypothetical protein
MTAEQLTDYLATGGIGTKGADLFFSSVPAEGTPLGVGSEVPAALVAVIPTPGWPRDKYTGTTHPTFQIRIRAETYAAAESKAAAIAALFRSEPYPKNNFLIGTDYIFLADFAQEPTSAFIGYDANNRAEFSLNLRLDVRG